VFTGDLIDAERAAAMDLVKEAGPGDELDDRVEVIVERLQNRPIANIGLAEEAIHGNLRQSWWDGLSREARLQSVFYDTPAHEEGINAFLNGRQLDFE